MTTDKKGDKMSEISKETATNLTSDSSTSSQTKQKKLVTHIFTSKILDLKPAIP